MIFTFCEVDTKIRTKYTACVAGEQHVSRVILFHAMEVCMFESVINVMAVFVKE
jgi:hypothetical protein